ncbi:arsenate reductase [Alteribacillus persepolensis]|uniref:Arsenate reductase n=1 Tax=Alteribacillus persepolensis TaxID=568899 RepID=A0A1G8DUS7_9BACI|nr:arsenate reductase family protein [Alteribacillus persepolensis]SDH61466.1 arsenate reductase [Alteribacillus persepolensis]
MALTYYGYARCGTCRKAKRWLDEHGIPYNEHDIVQNPPSREVIEQLYKSSGLPLKKFFNTSGKKYRELGMKEKVKTADESELMDWLASDGMLLKRPIVTDGEKVTVGFKEDQFEEVWKK